MWPQLGPSVGAGPHLRQPACFDLVEVVALYLASSWSGTVRSRRHTTYRVVPSGVMYDAIIADYCIHESEHNDRRL